MGRINSSPLAQEVKCSLSPSNFADKNSKNSAEFFILSDLYSEAMVVFLA
jgi:hypothetical protein